MAIAASVTAVRMNCAWLLFAAPAAPGFARHGFGGVGLSSNTNVVATHVAEIVEFGSGLSLPFIVERSLMLTIRVNLPTRSKKIARL